MTEGTFLWWVATAVAVSALALVAHVVVFRVVGRVGRDSPFIQDLIRRAQRPARVSLVLLVFLVLLPGAPLDPQLRGVIRHATSLVLMASAAWLFVVVSFVLQNLAMRRYRVDVPDNLRARRIHTQITVLRRITVMAVTVLTLGAMLMTFGRVRALGASVLASAGVVGIVLGVAARPMLGNVIAGIQTAFTEPVRLDDVVVVEGQWGRVEEITLTYVVVRIWDQRRLVLPISYFVSQPFENWSRRTTDLLGTVELHADYTVPVDEVRRELKRVLDASTLWDGRAWTLQVTNAGERTLTLRALMSARNAADAWDLRCEVRERLIGYLQRTHPGCLPRHRTELVNDVRGQISMSSRSRDEVSHGPGSRLPWAGER